MSVRRLTGVLGVLLAGPCLTFGSSVSWIPGQVAPAAWGIDPLQPNAAESISFQGPTKVYSNSCQAESAMGGTPEIQINATARVVELRFQAPAPAFCVTSWSPVCGLTGCFGPLDPGAWTFRCRNAAAPFEIPFVVNCRFPIHVDASAPGPIHDGKTWTSAFTSLQDGLDQATVGDQVLVAQGIYTPDVGQRITRRDRHATFQMKSGVTIKGGYGGSLAGGSDVRDVTQFQTILSGDLAGDDQAGFVNSLENSFHVVTASSVDSNAVLEGLTIRGGEANGTLSDRYGGGLYIHSGSPTICWCILRDNWAVLGGAIHTVYGQPLISHCAVRGNWAWVRGGGMYCMDSAPVVDNCVFIGNRADHGVLSTGGAICCVDGNLILNSSTLAGNLATGGRAVAFYTFIPQAAGIHHVSGCILQDGGSEISIDTSSVVAVTYSCVQCAQGVCTGKGNINADPRFIQAGSWTGNVWSDGDYHLRPDSPCTNKGDPTCTPSLEQVDFDGDLRVMGGTIDMGADEVSGSSAPAATAPALTFNLWGTQYPLQQDLGGTDPTHTYVGYTDQTINMNCKGTFMLQVQAASPAGGTWSGWVSPEVAGPGQVTVRIYVKGQGVDTTCLTEATASVGAADAILSVAPAS